MLIDANYELMADIDQRYQSASGLDSRAYYSIFYGPLLPGRLLMINANPGGNPDNYSMVDVMRGEHEYVEGRGSGNTTKNGSEILECIAGSRDPHRLRQVQVTNRFFRRSRARPSAKTEVSMMHEARPFLMEIIRFVQPDALLFGGNSGVSLFAQVHEASITAGAAVLGPNGSNDATYFQEYRMRLPGYKSIDAFGIYHPSKMNGVFRERIFPLLSNRLGSLLA